MTRERRELVGFWAIVVVLSAVVVRFGGCAPSW